MDQGLLNSIRWLLGLGAEELNLVQMAIRSILIYGTAVILVRIGDKRFLGRSSAFDVVLSVILGSVLSRAINGNAPFFPTLIAALVLITLHWLFAALAYRSDWFGYIIKGRRRELVKDGQIQWEEMRQSHFSERDLMMSLRQQGKTQDLEQVELATLERDGNISVIQKDHPPRLVDVHVASGVQTVRIELKGG